MLHLQITVNMCAIFRPTLLDNICKDKWGIENGDDEGNHNTEIVIN